MNWVSIDSGNGLSPVRRQAITWTNADLVSIEMLGTNFSEISIKIPIFSLKKIVLKIASAIFPPNGPGGDELTNVAIIGRYRITTKHTQTGTMHMIAGMCCIQLQMIMWLQYLLQYDIW